jgi:hypothetical protein
MNEKNRKRELAFWATSAFLLLGIAVFLFYSITFLVNSAADVMGENSSGGTRVNGFNLDDLEKLGLTQQEQP